MACSPGPANVHRQLKALHTTLWLPLSIEHYMTARVARALCRYACIEGNVEPCSGGLNNQLFSPCMQGHPTKHAGFFCHTQHIVGSTKARWKCLFAYRIFIFYFFCFDMKLMHVPLTFYIWSVLFLIYLGTIKTCKTTITGGLNKVTYTDILYVNSIYVVQELFFVPACLHSQWWLWSCY